jgi:hypothetical protein
MSGVGKKWGIGKAEFDLRGGNDGGGEWDAVVRVEAVEGWCTASLIDIACVRKLIA